MFLIKITTVGFLFLTLGLSVFINHKRKKKQKKIDNFYKNHVSKYRKLNN
jgi:preprotein translocase subunit SecG